MSTAEEDRVNTNITAFAQVAHQQNQAYKAAIGQPLEGSWSQMDSTGQQFVLDKVRYYLMNSHAVVSSLHDDWAYSQFNNGWAFGESLDEEKRTHPLLVLFSELPLTRQIEDLMFMQTVYALSRLM